MRPFVVRRGDADEIARLWGDLRRVARLGRGEEVVLDVSALARPTAPCDAFFLALGRRAAARGAAVRVVDPAGVLAGLRARADLPSLAALPPPRPRTGFFAAVGRAACAGADAARAHFAFLGETAVDALGLLLRPRRFRFRDAARAFERAGMDGLPITALIGALLGLILAFESAAALQMFGVEVYVADLIAIGLFRELGPLVTAIILAGRSGSAFAAEIGTMKVDEELDALTTFGLPPVRFLVLPRVVAATLAAPLLTIFAELAGLFGGALVLRLMDVPPSVYWRHVAASATSFMILLGLGKALLFGLLVGLIGCACGMRTRSTADGVGQAATRAVVGGIVAIAVADGLLAVVCHVLGV